jgi:hypothetical protein
VNPVPERGGRAHAGQGAQAAAAAADAVPLIVLVRIREPLSAVATADAAEAAGECLPKLHVELTHSLTRKSIVFLIYHVLFADSKAVGMSFHVVTRFLFLLLLLSSSLFYASHSKCYNTLT